MRRRSEGMDDRSNLPVISEVETLKLRLASDGRVFRLFIQVCLGFSIACFAYADQAQYLYDDQGRLASVSDSTGSTAVYNYDAVGNLLSIDRLTPPGSGIGIYLVNPATGPVTQLCRVQGYGFDRGADGKEAGSQC